MNELRGAGGARVHRVGRPRPELQGRRADRRGRVHRLQPLLRRLSRCGRGVHSPAGADHRRATGDGAARRLPPRIDEPACIGCNLCSHVCPVDGCITMVGDRRGKRIRELERSGAGGARRAAGRRGAGVVNERRLPDGRVELIDCTRIEASPLYNDDLAPVPIARRTWTTYNYAALWVSMAHCIPTYMLASGLMTEGMSWCAGALHHPARQHDRARADPPELAPRHEVRHPVPGLRARGLWDLRLQPARPDAGPRGLWLVWHPGVDRRRGQHASSSSLIPGWPTLLGAGFGGHADDRVAVVPALLGPERVHHLPRHGPAAAGGELGGPVRARHDCRAAGAGRSARPTASGRCWRSRASSTRSASSCRSSCPRSPR